MTAKKTADQDQDAGAKPTVELTDAEREAAEKEGLKAAYAQSAQTNFATRSATEGDSVGDRWPDRSDIMQFASMLDLDIDSFKAAISADANPGIPESKVAGLLGLERSGKNRTDWVAAMCERLGVKSPLEVTNAGPDFTNDTTPVNKIVR